MIKLSIKENSGVLSFFDNETGEKLCGFDGITDVSFKSESLIENGYEPKEHKMWSVKHNQTYGLSFNANEPIDTDKLMEVLGVDWSNKPDAYDVQYAKFVQVRKHKKKRINKKWIKRYGYKQILVDSKGWKLKMNTNGIYEFVK